MPRILELIRASALPAHQMMSAAKGAMHLPPAETVEILVYLAEHNKIFSEPATLTLAGWDEESAKIIAADPKTAALVLDYWLSPKNLRLSLFPLLLENESVSIAKLSELARTLNGAWADMMLASPRVRASAQLLQDLSSNRRLSAAQAAIVKGLLTTEPSPPAPNLKADESQEGTNLGATNLGATNPGATNPGATNPGATNLDAESLQGEDSETIQALTSFLTEHAAEIEASADKPFQPIGGIQDIAALHEQPMAAAAAAAPTAAASSSPVVADPALQKRGSVLQKITKLDVKGRIQLAMKGNKEERSILVRDGTKIVALAVLDSPKISDGEVEKFAGQRNVLEALLRAIPMKRRFAKNYATMRNLVYNPRTPLDASLGLMKGLLVQDLKNLTTNKEVSDTVRKLALRMFQQKTEVNKR
jgi:hypothetical protein